MSRDLAEHYEAVLDYKYVILVLRWASVHTVYKRACCEH
jgi:hypothetical protein